ncbi:hypothetical protein [Streptomyces sp. SAI-097]
MGDTTGIVQEDEHPASGDARTEHRGPPVETFGKDGHRLAERGEEVPEDEVRGNAAAVRSGEIRVELAVGRNAL